MNVVLVDIETRSRVDLPERGGLIYSRDPSTQILCFAWKETEGPSQGLWFPGIEIAPPKSAVSAILKDLEVYYGAEIPRPIRDLQNHTWVAHNAWGFDQPVWDTLHPDCRPAAWVDSSHLARACGLPGGLDAIGRTLRGTGKHTDGRGRLKQFMGYQKEPRAADLLLIGAYCWDDTGGLLYDLWKHIERKRKSGVFVEQDVIDADRHINATGIRCDPALATEILKLGQLSQQRLLKRIVEITGKESFGTLEGIRKVPEVHKWLKSKGVTLSELNKDYITRWLNDHDTEEPEGITGDYEEPEYATVAKVRPTVPADVVEFLKLRGQALKITAHKANAVLKSSCDGRLHNILSYGAAHTLRWGGRRFQPQNLSRPHEEVPVWPLLEKYALKGELGIDEVDALLKEYRPVNSKIPPATLEDACGSLIRSLLLPDEGEFICGVDYNAIEFRGAGWLAGEQSILDCFAQVRDPYIEIARKIYGVQEIDKKTPEGKTKRQVGKVVDLGSIYQLGDERLDGYAKSQGVDLAAAGTTPVACINYFRDWCPKLAGERTGRTWVKDGREIVIREGGFWKEVNAAAMEGVLEGYSVCGRLTFKMCDGDLHMILPSGRPLVYRKAKVELVPTKFGKDSLAVTYFSPRGFTNSLYGGKITENAVQAICRDLLAAALVRCLKAGVRVVLHVHDEIVASVRNEEEALLVGKLTAQKPSWASDFPVACEGEMMPRYAKSAPKGAYAFEVKG